MKFIYRTVPCTWHDGEKSGYWEFACGSITYRRATAKEAQAQIDTVIDNNSNTLQYGNKTL